VMVPEPIKAVSLKQAALTVLGVCYIDSSRTGLRPTNRRWKFPPPVIPERSEESASPLRQKQIPRRSAPRNDRRGLTLEGAPVNYGNSLPSAHRFLVLARCWPLRTSTQYRGEGQPGCLSGVNYCRMTADRSWKYG
jgi:hypothetical protein